jgi:cation diffusion facilitator family transporter
MATSTYHNGRERLEEDLLFYEVKKYWWVLWDDANNFSLNFAFMVVQACYGYLTDSLGLLSDSIHMFFDCLALGVGLFAAIAAKWPQSERFPYGFGKIESLSGFGNGVFLM